MKLKYLIYLLCGLMAICFIGSCYSLYTDNARLRHNQELLLLENTEYKKVDSLNTCKIQALSLKVDELEAYRAEDLALIKDLRLKKKNLESLIHQSTITINSLQAKLRDSIRVDTVHAQVDTLKCFSYRSKWLDAEGCVGDSLIDLSVVTRDSLITVESIVPKKLWFITLPVRLFGYKTHQIDILSKNPNTQIMGIEYVKIIK